MALQALNSLSKNENSVNKRLNLIEDYFKFEFKLTLKKWPLQFSIGEFTYTGDNFQEHTVKQRC